MKPRMTNKVRGGLSWLVGFGESYMEGDQSEDENGEVYYPSLGEAGTKEHNVKLAEIEAALEWIKCGGLSE